MIQTVQTLLNTVQARLTLSTSIRNIKHLIFCSNHQRLQYPLSRNARAAPYQKIFSSNSVNLKPNQSGINPQKLSKHLFKCISNVLSYMTHSKIPLNTISLTKYKERQPTLRTGKSQVRIVKMVLMKCSMILMIIFNPQQAWINQRRKILNPLVREDLWCKNLFHLKKTSNLRKKKTI